MHLFVYDLSNCCLINRKINCNVNLDVHEQVLDNGIIPVIENHCLQAMRMYKRSSCYS
jgi:hypothetical protein